MGVLLDPVANIKQIYLPSSGHLPVEQQNWVKFDVRPILVADLLELANYTEDDSRALKFLENRIVEWNLTDSAGTIRPINGDSLKLLTSLDYLFLKTVELENGPEALVTEEKKT